MFLRGDFLSRQVPLVTSCRAAVQYACPAFCRIAVQCTLRRSQFNPSSQEEVCRFEGGLVVKLNVRDRESIQEAVRRFRKLVERSGIKKEMRRREYYEKPSETRRRARLRAERRNRRTRLLQGGGV